MGREISASIARSLDGVGGSMCHLTPVDEPVDLNAEYRNVNAVATGFAPSLGEEVATAVARNPRGIQVRTRTDLLNHDSWSVQQVRSFLTESIIADLSAQWEPEQTGSMNQIVSPASVRGD